MSEQDLNAIFGEPGRGDYQPGDTITFIENGHEYTGEVVHCTAPKTTVKGHHLPLSYGVDCNDGFPHIVIQSQIVVK